MKTIAFTIVIIVTIASCRPAKKVQHIEEAISKKDTSTRVIVNPEKVVDSLALVKNIIADITKKRIDFTTFTGKVKIEYEGKENSDQATAYVRMQKDSLIWVSLTGALGIEGIRVLINKDSVKLMNKLQKTVQYRSIAYLQELTEVPFDFYALQDMIIGNPVFLDSNIVSYQSNGKELFVLMVGMFSNTLLPCRIMILKCCTASSMILMQHATVPAILLTMVMKMQVILISLQKEKLLLQKKQSLILISILNHTILTSHRIILSIFLKIISAGNNRCAKALT